MITKVNMFEVVTGMADWVFVVLVALNLMTVLHNHMKSVRYLPVRVRTSDWQAFHDPHFSPCIGRADNEDATIGFCISSFDKTGTND